MASQHLKNYHLPGNRQIVGNLPSRSEFGKLIINKLKNSIRILNYFLYKSLLCKRHLLLKGEIFFQSLIICYTYIWPLALLLRWILKKITRSILKLLLKNHFYWYYIDVMKYIFCCIKAVSWKVDGRLSILGCYLLL